MQALEHRHGLLAAGLAGLALLGAALAAGQEEGTAAAGQAAFARLCAGCHADPRGIGGRAARLEDPARRAALDRFLARHHATEAPQRAAVLAWLAEVTR